MLLLLTLNIYIPFSYNTTLINLIKKLQPPMSSLWHQPYSIIPSGFFPGTSAKQLEIL